MANPAWAKDYGDAWKEIEERYPATGRYYFQLQFYHRSGSTTLATALSSCSTPPKSPNPTANGCPVITTPSSNR